MSETISAIEVYDADDYGRAASCHEYDYGEKTAAPTTSRINLNGLYKAKDIITCMSSFREGANVELTKEQKLLAEYLRTAMRLHAPDIYIEYTTLAIIPVYSSRLNTVPQTIIIR